jgi:hypothetical protein
MIAAKVVSILSLLIGAATTAGIGFVLFALAAGSAVISRAIGAPDFKVNLPADLTKPATPTPAPHP